MFSKIPSTFLGEIVDLLDNNTLNLAYAKKVISKIFDETNKSPLQVSMHYYRLEINEDSNVVVYYVLCS